MAELLSLTLIELTSALRQKRASPVELLDEVFAAIDRATRRSTPWCCSGTWCGERPFARERPAHPHWPLRRRVVATGGT